MKFSEYLQKHRELNPDIVYEPTPYNPGFVQLVRLWGHEAIMGNQNIEDVVVFRGGNMETVPNPYLIPNEGEGTEDGPKSRKGKDKAKDKDKIKDKDKDKDKDKTEDAPGTAPDSGNVPSEDPGEGADQEGPEEMKAG